MEYQFHNGAKLVPTRWRPSRMLPFALNHMTTPNLGWEAFLDLAKDLGCVGVEFRNDFKTALFDGADPAVVGAAVRARGLRFLALAEGKMFNDRSEEHTSELQSQLHLAFPLLL